MDIIKEQFWKRNQWIGDAGFPLEDKHISHEDIVQKLEPFLTDDRKSRIQQVLAGRTMNIIPVMENIYDRGNISAAMRSAEAYGFTQFHIIEAEDARFKSANRVTQGADKWLKVQNFNSTKDCLTQLKQNGFKIYATDLQASHPIGEIDFSTPSAIVFGNEKDGISNEMRKHADANVVLPMTGFAQSFNISVAAALAFYHIWTDRNQRLGKSGDLTESQRKVLLGNYYLKAVNNAKHLLEA